MTTTLLPDFGIEQYVQTHGMISPFSKGEKRPGIISYGCSSYGYDVRLGTDFKLYYRNHDFEPIVDPKDFKEDLLIKTIIGVHDPFVIPPHGVVLGITIEYFKIPDNMLVLCIGKSTYARCGIIVNVTPLEPGWEGFVTLEIHNTTDFPAVIYPNEGICQFLFFEGLVKPLVTYKNKGGKYQGATGVDTPKVD